MTKDLAPSVNCKDIQLNIDPNNVQIKLEGNGVTKIASVFEGIIKNDMIPAVVKAAQTQVPTIVNTVGNKDLANFGTHEALPDLPGITFDYSLVAAPEVNSAGYIGASILGSFYETAGAS